MAPAANRTELARRFAQSIALQIELPNVFQEAIARSRELCEADGASLILVDQDTGELRFDTLSGQASNPLHQVRLRPGQGIAGKAASEAMSQLVVDAQAASDFDSSFDSLSGFKTGSIMAVPLINGGDVVGVLQAVRRSGREPFTEENLRQLEELAPHITIAVRNSQMREELREMHARVLAANVELERKIVDRTQQLSRAKSEWEQTFDAISEPIALQDGYVVRRANAEYARRASVDIRQVPGRLCYELLANRDSPCQGCPLLQGRSGQLRGEMVDRNSSILQFSGFWASEAPFDAGVVVHYRDITTERRLAARLRESERLASLGQLASGAAHEINNPIGFVISNLEGLRTQAASLGDIAGAISEAAAGVQAKDLRRASTVLEQIRKYDLPAMVRDHREMVEDSIEGAQRVSKIVRALRELARQEVDVVEPCCVNASITRVVRAESGGDLKEVILDLQSEGHAEISPLQLDHALEQLLRNARQAVTQNQKITVRSLTTSSEQIIEVEDEGCGILPEHLHRVFEPFFTTRAVGQGIGLGLTVAYGVVARNHGTISVHSEAGRGTKFTIALPRSKRAVAKEVLRKPSTLAVSAAERSHVN